MLHPLDHTESSSHWQSLIVAVNWSLISLHGWAIVNLWRPAWYFNIKLVEMVSEIRHILVTKPLSVWYSYSYRFVVQGLLQRVLVEWCSSALLFLKSFCFEWKWCMYAYALMLVTTILNYACPSYFWQFTGHNGLVLVSWEYLHAWRGKWVLVLRGIHIASYIYNYIY